jgi:hypothetical protein
MTKRGEAAAEVLRRTGGITDYIGTLYGVRDVRKAIYDLRQEGWHIETCSTCYGCQGHPGRGHYVLVSEPGAEPAQTAMALA